MSRRRGGLRPALAPVTLLWLCLIVGAMAPPAAAHPLGNFTVNTSAGLVVSPDEVRIVYVVDLAELPAVRVVGGLDADGDGDVSEAEGEGYRREECARLAGGLALAVDGRAVAPTVTATSLALPPGEAGLPTLRLGCTLTAPGSVRELTLRDGNHEDQAGWREITAAGEGVEVSADVPAVSPSAGLTRYPEDRLSAPLDQRAATVRVGAAAGDGGTGEGTVAAAPAGGLEQRFLSLVGGRALGAGVAVLGVVLAVLLGGLHALAPGHGKAVLAATMVAGDGSGREALGLALVIAVAHTTGVLALGAALTVTELVAPDRLYRWLGLVSGLLFAATGAALLRRTGRAHHHEHDHPHPAARGWRRVVLPGLAGGMVPTPSALVVLLGGIALGRAWFGVLLVLAYGVGMAAVLVGAGWLLLRARGPLTERLTAPRGRRALAALPRLSALAVIAGGLTLAVRAALTLSGG